MKLCNRLSIALICSLAASAASAGVISHNGYSYDDNANYAVGDGLDWLRWDQTVGQSIDDAVATHSVDGYRVATNAEMATLYNNFAFTTPGYWADDEDNQQSIQLSSNVETILFNSIFGITYTTGSDYSAAWFGADDDGDGLINAAVVRTPFAGSSANPSALLQGDVFYSPSDSLSNSSVALVRVSVPEPSILFLFATGLLGLGLRPKRKK